MANEWIASTSEDFDGSNCFFDDPYNDRPTSREDVVSEAPDELDIEPGTTFYVGRAAPMAKTAFEGATRGTTFYLPPEDLVIETDPTHPLYDPRERWPLDEGLKECMKWEGFTSIIEVIKVGDKPVVNDGRRRTIAARAANIELREAGAELLLCECKLVRGDAATLYGRSLSANEHRRQDPPLMRAEKIARYIAMGRPVVRAAVVFGLSVPTVEKHLRLLEADASVKTALEEKRISFTRALELVDKPIEKQRAAIEAGLPCGMETADAPEENGARTPDLDAPRKVTPPERKRSLKPPTAKVRRFLKIAEESDNQSEELAEAIEILRWVLGDAKCPKSIAKLWKQATEKRKKL